MNPSKHTSAFLFPTSDFSFTFVFMTAIKRLAGQTAIYGIPSVLGRVLTYLLVPLYTHVFHAGDYGTVNVFYALTAFLMVVLTYGMETTFFRFNEQEKEKEKVLSTAMISIIISSAVFLILVLLFSGNIADWMLYPNHPEYIRWFAWILVLDALSAIPFAHLRAINRPIRFAWVKMVNIAINISLNLFFLIFCPYFLNNFPDGQISHFIVKIYRTNWGIEYIFISNLIRERCYSYHAAA